MKYIESSCPFFNKLFAYYLIGVIEVSDLYDGVHIFSESYVN